MNNRSSGGSAAQLKGKEMTERAMRAKMAVGMVQQHRTRDWNPETKQYEGEGVVTMETLALHAVAAPKYDASGLDEDNTFAKMSPGANMSINIANPALIGSFHVGQRFYVDFTEAPDSPKAL